MAVRHSGRRKHGAVRAVGATVAATVCVALATWAFVLLVQPPFVLSALASAGVRFPDLPFLPSQAASEEEMRADRVADDRETRDAAGFGAVGDKQVTAEEAEGLAAEARRTRQTPLVARCSGVDLRCAVVLPDVTGIIFHQASYGYALPLDTELPEADYEKAADTRTIRVNRDQDAKPDDWADAEALHLWRTTDATEMDTSIDIGAAAGAEVRSPVTGTVVLVRDYQLYEEMPDIEVHIQPDGRPDLDCVLIHLADAGVKAGDKVQAGITPIASVRDIESVLTDVQLGFFTPEGTGGNHTHVQVNNADHPGYREKRLEGAITP